jgi:hypothetical protein
MGIFYKAIVHKKRFGQAYIRNLLKMNPRKFSSHFSEFFTIYFLQKLKLKYNNYSEEETNMSYFVQSIEHDMSMHARFGD